MSEKNAIKQSVSDELDRRIVVFGEDRLISKLYCVRAIIRLKLNSACYDDPQRIFGVKTCENLQDWFANDFGDSNQRSFEDFKTLLKPRDSLLLAFYVISDTIFLKPRESLLLEIATTTGSSFSPILGFQYRNRSWNLFDGFLFAEAEHTNTQLIRGAAFAWVTEVGGKSLLYVDRTPVRDSVSQVEFPPEWEGISEDSDGNFKIVKASQMMNVTYYQLLDALDMEIVSRGGEDRFINYVYKRSHLMKMRLKRKSPELVGSIFNTNACVNLKEWIINFNSGGSQRRFEEFRTLLTSRDSQHFAFCLSEFYDLFDERRYAATGPWNTQLLELLLRGLNESDNGYHDAATISASIPTGLGYPLNMKAAITQSVYIRNGIDHFIDEKVITLPKFTDSILPQMDDFMKNIYNFGKGARLLIHLFKDYVARFESWTTNFLNNNKSDLPLLKKAANCMDIKSLLYLTSRALGDTKKGRGVEDTSKWFAGFSISPFLSPPLGICKASAVEDAFSGLSRLFSSLDIF